MRVLVVLLMGVLPAIVACHLPLPPPPGDGPPVDVRRADARRDAPRRDGPTLDASRPDGVRRDGAKTCDDVYKNAPGYTLCNQTATTCEFRALTQSASTEGNCKALCSQYGGACVTAFDNPSPPGDLCTRIQEDACEQPRTDEICVCTLP